LRNRARDARLALVVLQREARARVRFTMAMWVVGAVGIGAWYAPFLPEGH